MQTYECDNCGGRIEFSPTDKALRCVNCGNLYSINYKREIAKKPISANISLEELTKWANATKVFKCGNCGAQTTLNKFDLQARCSYCKTESLIPIKDLPGLKPEIIIPFKVSKQTARDVMLKGIKKAHFVPHKLKNEVINIPVGATYISSFTFSCLANAGFKGVERYDEYEFDAFGRRSTTTRSRTITGRINHNFSNIVVEASDKILQKDINEILPYDFREAYDYNDDFIKGYSIGYYNQTVESAEMVAKNLATEELKRILMRKYPKMEKVEVYPTFTEMKYNYAILPIYFVNVEYKKKTYTSLINGQTGKDNIKLPKSGKQITSVVLFILMLIALPLLFIFLS